MKTDDKREFKTTDNGYFISSRVNYPNNKVLVKQNVYINKNGKINKVEVVDKDGNVQIRMVFNTIKYNKNFDNKYFELSNLLNKSNNISSGTNTSNSGTVNNTTGTTTSDSGTISGGTVTDNSGTTNNTTGTSTSNSGTNSKQTASIKDVLYPMYLPNNTYLTNQEVIDTINGQRMILTFGGDSSFVLVEETASYSDEAMVIPVSGEFDFLSDVIGVINNNSIMWQSGGFEYYITSDTVKTSELLDIARSISVLPVSK